MRIIAVIPNYNASSNLEPLLRSVLKLRFDNVFVLDDLSTDNSLEVLAKFGNKITVVKGDTNLGPAGNRNRILPFMRQTDYLVFIDADMEVLSGDFRKKMLAIFSEETTIGVIGGLVFNKKDEPMTFNYGYHSNAWRDMVGSFFEHIAMAVPPLRNPLRTIARPFTLNLDIRFAAPERRIVDWTSEAFCIVRGDVFRELQGFNPVFRYHEGQDLAERFYLLGYRVMFWPEIHAKHLEIQTRPHRRTLMKNWFTLRQNKNKG